MIKYEEVKQRLDKFTENDKLFYFQGHIPVKVDRKNYLPDVYDGRTFYGFQHR